jgi:hypothetical protein
MKIAGWRFAFAVMAVLPSFPALLGAAPRNYLFKQQLDAAKCPADSIASLVHDLVAPQSELLHHH